MDLYHIPAGDDITSGEMLEHYPRQRSDIQGIYLDQVSRGLNFVVFWLSYGIGSLKPSSMGGDVIPYRLPEHPTVL